MSMTTLQNTASNAVATTLSSIDARLSTVSVGDAERTLIEARARLEGNGLTSLTQYVGTSVANTRAAELELSWLAGLLDRAAPAWRDSYPFMPEGR
jgi:hypothetical protein